MIVIMAVVMMAVVMVAVVIVRHSNLAPRKGREVGSKWPAGEVSF